VALAIIPSRKATFCLFSAALNVLYFPEGTILSAEGGLAPQFTHHISLRERLLLSVHPVNE